MAKIDVTAEDATQLRQLCQFLRKLKPHGDMNIDDIIHEFNTSITCINKIILSIEQALNPPEPGPSAPKKREAPVKKAGESKTIKKAK